MTSGNGALVPLPALPGAVLALPSEEGILAVSLPDSAIADGFLRLSSHILLQARRKPFRSVGITSAGRGEGKTTAALNLAICLGRTQGRVGRVLLVDGDTAQRTLTRLIGGRGADGVAADPILTTTPFTGVDLMTAPTRNDALSLHDPAAWAQSLRALSARYRILIVDCPSVLANPEGLVLPSCVEEVVWVVGANRTTREDVRTAFAAVGKPALGMILNRGSPRNGHPPRAR